nr:Dr1-like protein [Cryptomonas sp.]
MENFLRIKMSKYLQSSRKNLKKIIEETIYQMNIRVSKKSINSLIELCLYIIEELSSKIGNFYGKDIKKILSEENILLILSQLGLKKYISETREEMKRIIRENEKMEKIIL